MKRTSAALTVAASIAYLTVATVPAGAWGAQGHRLVSQIAAEHMTPVARDTVAWLIGPENLTDVASWADQYLQGNYQTFFWHFINIPPSATAYDRDRDCPRQPGVEAGSWNDRWRDCIVDRIPYNEERLTNASLDRADRAIALKFLVHFVGDVHQPYHALGVERGGNGVFVSIFGRTECGNDPARSNPCNLHSVWDSALISHRGLDDPAYLAVLRDLIKKNGWTTDAPGTAAQWAMESHAIAKAALLPQHGIVDEGYYRAHIGDIDRRLAQAGVRLAALLNRSLTKPPPAR
jgi:nuclease S1